MSVDPPYFLWGTPKPPLGWHPTDGDVNPEEGLAAFSEWVSGYYNHGDHQYQAEDKLEYRSPNSGLKNTIATMSEEDVGNTLDSRPGSGSDEILRKTGNRVNAWPANRDNAFFGKADYLPRTKIVYVWGSRGHWETVMGPWAIKNMIEKAQTDNVRHRKTEFVEVKEANHFVGLYSTGEKIILTCIAVSLGFSRGCFTYLPRCILVPNMIMEFLSLNGDSKSDIVVMIVYGISPIFLKRSRTTRHVLY